jgi:hypothetical protein
MAKLDVGNLAKKAMEGKTNVSGKLASSAKNKAGGVKNSFAALFIGLGIVLLCAALLTCNEASNVKKIRAFAEAERVLLETGSAQLNPDNQGKLVAIQGTLTFTPVADPIYRIGANSFVIKRNVEMYQWKETRNSNRAEDGTVTYTYTYSKVWNDELIDSSGFNDKEKKNPAWPSQARYQAATVYADDIMLGDFNPPRRLAATTLVTPPDNVPEGMYRNSNYFTNYSGDPDIGAIRVSWQTNTAKSASALGVQSGNNITAYTAKNGTDVFRFSAGIVTGSAMINSLKEGNKASTAAFRIILAIFICVGFILVFMPINALVNLIPFLGKYLSKATSAISAVVGIIVGVAVSLVIILLSWIAVRPGFAIPVLLIIGGLIVLAVVQKKKNAALEAAGGGAIAAAPDGGAIAAPEATGAAAGAWTCSCGQTGNTGKFCSGCGKPMPTRSSTWDCTCGKAGNTGGFCAECGKPRE